MLNDQIRVVIRKIPRFLRPPKEIKLLALEFLVPDKQFLSMILG